MRVPLSWLGELVDLAPGATGADVAAALVSVGLEEEALHGGDITGPLVVGRVLAFQEQIQKNGKPIRFCTVDVGQHGQRVTDGIAAEIVCGATNFAVGDLVVVVLPGAVLPGGFEISARKTYGRVSNGMICAEDELGLGEDHTGIIVLRDYLGEAAVAGLAPGDDALALLGLGEQVLDLILRLKERNLAVVVISHNLADVFAVCDRIVVLFLGRAVASFDAKTATREEVVGAITGLSLPAQDGALT